jgi:hypothetical protein
LQGAANFKKEFEQLRRAFRYDEFETVTNANPPSNAVQKVLSLRCVWHRVHARCAADLIRTKPCKASHISHEWLLTLCVHWQAIGQAGSGFVKFFAGIDRKAEEAGVFPKLTPSPVPEEVIDSDGSVDNAVDDVRLLSGGHITPSSCQPPWTPAMLLVMTRLHRMCMCSPSSRLTAAVLMSGSMHTGGMPCLLPHLLPHQQAHRACSRLPFLSPEP